MRFLLRLFGEESAFGRFLNRLYVVIVTNLLFVLFSIPVFTIGASLSAMPRESNQARTGASFSGIPVDSNHAASCRVGR